MWRGLGVWRWITWETWHDVFAEGLSQGMGKMLSMGKAGVCKSWYLREERKHLWNHNCADMSEGALVKANFDTWSWLVEVQTTLEMSCGGLSQ
jgi:hypothetical protein